MNNVHNDVQEGNLNLKKNHGKMEYDILEIKFSVNTVFFKILKSLHSNIYYMCTINENYEFIYSFEELLMEK